MCCGDALQHVLWRCFAAKYETVNFVLVHALAQSLFSPVSHLADSKVMMPHQKPHYLQAQSFICVKCSEDLHPMIPLEPENAQDQS